MLIPDSEGEIQFLSEFIEFIKRHNINHFEPELDRDCYFKTDSHWNNKGHEMVSKETISFLEPFKL